MSKIFDTWLNDNICNWKHFFFVFCVIFIFKSKILIQRSEDPLNPNNAGGTMCPYRTQAISRSPTPLGIIVNWNHLKKEKCWNFLHPKLLFYIPSQTSLFNENKNLRPLIMVELRLHDNFLLLSTFRQESTYRQRHWIWLSHPDRFHSILLIA